MRKLINSIIGSFTVGCMIFMVSGLIPYWEHGTLVFETISQRYDEFVFGIFIVALVAGGMGHFIYQLNCTYNLKVILHYGATFITVMVVSIWLDIISITWSQILSYSVTVSVIFAILWVTNYINIKKEAEELNALLKQRGNE